MDFKMMKNKSDSYMDKENKFEAADFLKISFYLALAALVWNLPTLGNNLMPRNFMGWFGIIVIASSLVAFVAFKGKLYFHKALLLLFIPPLAILIHGSIFTPSETMSYYMWLAIGATFSFSIFFISLLQVNDEDHVWLNISNILLFVFTIQTYLSEVAPAFQFGRFIISNLPIELRAEDGGFQQANLMASFAATLILWSWSLRIKFNDRRIRSWIYLSVMAMLLGFIVFQTGSRTAGLSLLIGVIFLAVYSFGEKKLHFSSIVILGIAVALVFDSFGGVGESRKGDFVSAAANVVSSRNTDVRIIFWHVSYLSGLEEWLFGHGLGEFQRAFYQTYLLNKLTHSNWFHTASLAHPHNEILMHWVEMGLFGMLFVVSPVALFLIFLVLQNKKFSLLIITSLLPVAIHSQTEMVLHASGAHWLLIGLVAASLVNRDWLKEIELSKNYLFFAPILGGIFGIYLTVSTSIVGTNSWKNKAMADVAPDIGTHLKRLTQGEELNHWILGTETNDRVIKVMMAYALNVKNKSAVRKFLPRLIDQNDRWQQNDSWAMIAQAYLLLNDLVAYEAHIKKVRIFDSNFADFLTKQFNVKFEN